MSGVSLGYFDFFPVRIHENVAEFGRVPTWGTCTVTASKCEFVPVGQRVYGLVPISKYFKATPRKSMDPTSWIDSAPHRTKRDVVYNTYTVLSLDRMYPGEELEEAMILVRPLFLTAWLLREAVMDLKVDTVIITSASSKTGAALAALLQQSNRNLKLTIRIIGLTSAGNWSYTNSLGFYDQVLSYYDTQEGEAFLTTIESSSRVAVVDMAGNIPVLKQLQLKLNQRLVKIFAVGITHVGDSDMSSTFSGKDFDPRYPKPEFFFAPKYAALVLKRNPIALTQSATIDWLDFIQRYPLHIKHCETMAQIQDVLQDFVNGRVPGDISWVALLKNVELLPQIYSAL